ncbi:hypothetical protein J4217_01670 [Candidatus Pacearchaeota archaeon]|nr:hypothetical protein [Candidatus Pacearchaeota archaeon]
MSKESILKRENRMARRKKAIANDECPNCGVKLRDKWRGGGMYCPKCNWEK